MFRADNTKYLWRKVTQNVCEMHTDLKSYFYILFFFYYVETVLLGAMESAIVNFLEITKMGENISLNFWMKGHCVYL